MSLTQKTVLVLESPKDWDKWYEIVRRTVRVLSISHLVDLNAPSTPRGFIRSECSTFRDVKSLATSYTELNVVDKDTYKVLQTDYYIAIARFDKEEAAVRDLILYIQDTIALSLETYFRDLDISYEIL